MKSFEAPTTVPLALAEPAVKVSGTTVAHVSPGTPAVVLVTDRLKEPAPPPTFFTTR